MANHKSALKRIRSDEKRRVRRRYYAKTMRTAVKRFRDLADKNEAEKQLPGLVKMIDKNVSRNILHKNKAANLKSSLMRQLKNM
ncbi:MAG: 30S ribosomal protein S20 [Bacteroidales bacterium]